MSEARANKASLTTEQVELSIELHKKGWLQREIAEHFHVAQSTISRSWKEYGYKPKRGHVQKLSNKEIDRVRTLYEQGYSKQEISYVLGHKSVSGVHHRMQKYGIPTRSQSEANRLAAMKRYGHLRAMSSGDE